MPSRASEEPKAAQYRRRSQERHLPYRPHPRYRQETAGSGWARNGSDSRSWKEGKRHCPERWHERKKRAGCSRADRNLNLPCVVSIHLDHNEGRLSSPACCTDRGWRQSKSRTTPGKQVAVDRHEDRVRLKNAALVTEMRAAVPAAHVVVVVLLNRLLPALTAHTTTSAAHVDTALRAQ